MWSRSGSWALGRSIASLESWSAGGVIGCQGFCIGGSWLHCVGTPVCDRLDADLLAVRTGVRWLLLRPVPSQKVINGL